MSKEKVTFVNKYENYKEHEGHTNTGESVTDKSKTIDCDIYACIEKYGIGTLARKYEATEYLYADVTHQPKTLDEAIKQREELDTYFKNQPARVRKQFGDSTEEFYQKFKAGEFKDFIKTGVLTEEIANRYMEEMNNVNTNSTLEQTNTTNTDIPTDTGKGDM